MHSLEVSELDRFLVQVVVLAVSRPSVTLNRLVEDLCARSLRLACKTTWLLCAHASDGRAVSAETVAALRWKCEEAAAIGTFPTKSFSLSDFSAAGRWSLAGHGDLTGWNVVKLRKVSYLPCIIF